MSVNDGQKANDTTFNDAFLSRITDSDTIAKIDLKNADSAEILDAQQTINDQRTDIDQNRADIDTNDTELADHEIRISDNEADILQAQSDITDLENDTVDLTTNQTIAGEKTFSNDAVFEGNVTINGTQTILNTEILEVEDKNVVINNNGDDISAEGAGLTVERTGVDGSIVYEDALDNKFKIGSVGTELEVGTVIKDTDANIQAIVSPSTSARYYATDTGKNYLYDALTTSFLEVGSGGEGGGGVGSPDTLFVDDAETANLADPEWTGTDGFIISQTDPINGDNVFLGTHDASLEKNLKKTFDIPIKFRGKNITMIFDLNSGAQFGDVTLTIDDLTNAVVLVDGEALQLSGDVNASTKGYFLIVLLIVNLSLMKFHYSLMRPHPKQD
jgi:hypothetical protein